MFRIVRFVARLTPKNLLGKSLICVTAVYAHVILIVPIQYKKSPFQSEFMLLYLMSDR